MTRRQPTRVASPEVIGTRGTRRPPGSGGGGESTNLDLCEPLALTTIHTNDSQSSDNTLERILTPDIMEEAYAAITHGVLRKVVTDGDAGVPAPILQCVQIKPMGGNAAGASERYRVVLNDTVNFIQCMLAVQANGIVTSGQLEKGAIVKLNQFQTSFVKDKHILVIIDIEVLPQYGIHEKLGEPVTLEPAKPAATEDVKPQPDNIAANNFYGNSGSSNAKPQNLPSRSNGASHNNSSHGNIHPIEALSPYSHKWTIKARCTHKGDIKTWHNKNGEGKLFSVNFLDESGEIRATGFNDAVDQWYDVLQENSVYYISSPCRVQLAKKQFSNVNHDYELTFERDTVIEKAEDMDGVPQVRFNFTTIADLQNVEKDATVDVIGVLSEVGEVSDIVSKTTQKPYSKRELTLVDNTGYNVRLTIWGKSASSFSVPTESVVAFKGVKVSDFNGRSLSLLSSGGMTADPDIEEAYKLKGWYDGTGRTEQFASHANTMPSVGAATGGNRDPVLTIGKVLDDNIGMGGETQYYSIKATIIFIKSDNGMTYPACQTKEPKPCNKKVLEEDNGGWRCEKCQRTWERPDYRYIMSINVSDHTGQIWLSCFNETGQQLLGMSANDLMALKDEDDKAYLEVVQNAMCQTFNFKCRASMDTFNEQQRYVVRSESSYDPNILTDLPGFVTRFNTQTRSTSPTSRRSWPM